jgi:nucleoside-diphosphate-sugar epimerase
MNNSLTIFITGGAGYVGAMLADQWHDRADVKELILLDKEPMPDLLKGKSKITYIQQNMSEDGWQEKVMPKRPDVVIHTAWEIREKYGDRATQWKWNVEGSNKVLDFTLSFSSVKKLIHFSTVASYGAYRNNNAEYRFTEEDPFRKTDYSYAEEKRVVEKNLEEKYQKARAAGREVEVFVLRPAAITGPRGRFMRLRFGLQSALSGQLKGSKSIAYRVISGMVGFVPATREWVRQFIHEDDVNDIVTKLVFEDLPGQYEIFNICPPGEIVRAKDMAKAVGKRTLPVTPQMVRFAYFFAWHLSRGKIPTARGSWKSYSFPIAVDGSKITKKYGYQYKYNSLDAFTKKEGRYAKYVK